MSLFDSWVAALEARHLSDLRRPEVARALRALSIDYVHRRQRVGSAGNAALEGRGKRAAFALFYAPLHFLVVREIVRAVGAAVPLARIVDIGCGTGAAGAAWASEIETAPEIFGIDRLGWALEEATFTYRHFRLRHRIRRGRFPDLLPPRARSATGLIAAYTINELDDDARERARATLLDRAGSGDTVLIIEPIARGVAPWWDAWVRSFHDVRGRADEWRFRLPLPVSVAGLAHAAGLDPREQTARSIWVPAFL